MIPLHPYFVIGFPVLVFLVLVWDVWAIRRDLARERRREQAR